MCAIEFTVSFLRKVLIFIISFVFCKIPDPRFPLSRFPVVHNTPCPMSLIGLSVCFFFVKIYILWFRTDRINIYGFVFFLAAIQSMPKRKKWNPKSNSFAPNICLFLFLQFVTVRFYICVSFFFLK